MAKTPKKTELTETDKYYIVENRTKLTEDDLAAKLNVTRKLVVEFIKEFTKSMEVKADLKDYAGKSGSLAATPASGEKGDESYKNFRTKEPAEREGVHIIRKNNRKS